MEQKSKVILNFFGLCLFIGIIGFLLSQSVGLGGSGFDTTEVLQQFSFYLAGGIFLVLMICGFIIEYIIRKGDERYGENLLFTSLGEKPSWNYFKKYSQFRMIFLSMIIFGILGMFMYVTKQTSFTGIKPLAEQFTPTGELLFNTLLVPISENLGLALVLLTTILVIRYFARKYNWSYSNYAILTYVFTLLMGSIYWITNHLLRYSGSDTSLLTILGFGFTMSLITLLTGSFIPAWIMHLSNNLFFDLQGLFAKESLIIYVGIILVVLVFLYLWIFRKGSKISEVNPNVFQK